MEYEVKRKPIDGYGCYDIIEIYYNGEKFFVWHDNAHTDYPEDLSWNRMISEVFEKGVELGKLLSRKAR